MDEQDPFEVGLGLEDKYYAEGFALGEADGSRAGRVEGRIFGLERGFDKFFAMGAMHGRSAVWAGRLAQNAQEAKKDEELGVEKKAKELSLPPLADNARLEKHVRTLYALVEPESLSTENNEEAVSEFDDRFKRAGAKLKVVEKIVGEESHAGDGETGQQTNQTLKKAAQDKNMEDFDSPLLRR